MWKHVAQDAVVKVNKRPSANWSISPLLNILIVCLQKIKKLRLWGKYDSTNIWRYKMLLLFVNTCLCLHNNKHVQLEKTFAWEGDITVVLIILLSPADSLIGPIMWHPWWLCYYLYMLYYLCYYLYILPIYIYVCYYLYKVLSNLI